MGTVASGAAHAVRHAKQPKSVPTPEVYVSTLGRRARPASRQPLILAVTVQTASAVCQ